MLCFVLINSVLLNFLFVWILFQNTSSHSCFRFFLLLSASFSNPHKDRLDTAPVCTVFFPLWTWFMLSGNFWYFTGEVPNTRQGLVFGTLAVILVSDFNFFYFFKPVNISIYWGTNQQLVRHTVCIRACGMCCTSMFIMCNFSVLRAWTSVSVGLFIVLCTIVFCIVLHYGRCLECIWMSTVQIPV